MAAPSAFDASDAPDAPDASTTGAAWSGPTTDFWQTLHEPGPAPAPTPGPPWQLGVPVQLPDGRWLELPVRQLPGTPDRAVASLIANQASLPVIRALSGHMAALCGPFAPEVIVGLPTLGLMFAPQVAELLGHARFVPLGYSRKFWYDDALSEPVQSITSPTPGKRLYLDPNQLPLIAGRRVVVIDDVISSGTTLLASLKLLLRAGAQVSGIVVAMLQGEAWREALAQLGPEWPGKVAGAFYSPRLRRGADGWYPL